VRDLQRDNPAAHWQARSEERRQQGFGLQFLMAKA